jgi:monoterpene epsilon-lactone hydrolase
MSPNDHSSPRVAGALPDAPVPSTVSEMAQALLRNGLPLPEAEASSLSEKREVCERIQREFGAQLLHRYPVLVEDGEISNVPVRIFTPKSMPDRNRDRVLLNLHGGGFTKDSGSLTENIAISYLTKTTVIAICYRLAPENPFPAAVDDAEAVYRTVLSRYAPSRVGIYGTSAGAILSAQTIARLVRKQLPVPAALGFFTGTADLSRAGDSEYFFPLPDDPRPFGERAKPFFPGRSLDDPEISPLLGDLSGFPPTLCVCGTRDLMLSQTSLFHRALLRSGVHAELIVFEAMPHAHWSYLDLPETDEAFAIMGRFFDMRL